MDHFYIGLDAYKAEDYKKALQEWELAAAENNSAAMFNLAILYGNGMGVEKSREKRAEWMQKSAEYGNLQAQHQLAKIYQLGDGVPSDSVQQWKWHRRAAEAGYMQAMEDMARGYYYGSIGQKDYVLAMDWAQKAKDHGSTEMDGIIEGSREKIQEAEAQRRRLEEIGQLPGGKEYLLALERIEEKKKGEAIPLLQTAAQSGIPEAAGRLMEIYGRLGFSRFKNEFYDLDKAIYYGNMLYELGNMSGISYLICLYMRKEQYRDALRWAMIAKENGDAGEAERLEKVRIETCKSVESAFREQKIEEGITYLQKAIMLGTKEFSFGRNVSDSGYERGTLKWHVVRECDSEVLAVCDSYLKCMPFHSAFSPVNWEESDLYRWLNQEFKKTVFREEEREYLAAGVFLLSVEEAMLLRERMPEVMTAKMDGSVTVSGEYRPKTDAVEWWWLRTPGENRMSAACVDKDGNVEPDGRRVYCPQGGVRPAIRIKYQKNI